MKFCKKLAGALHVIEHGGCWLSAFAVFFMAVITTIDVVGRYFLNHSITGTQELVQLSMNVFVYAGLTWAIYKKDYVTVPVILDKLKPKARLIVETVVVFLMFAAGCILCYSLWVSAIKWTHKWTVVTTTLGIPQTPFYLLTAVCITIVCIELLVQTINNIAHLANFNKPALDTVCAAESGVPVVNAALADIEGGTPETKEETTHE